MKQNKSEFSNNTLLVPEVFYLSITFWPLLDDALLMTFLITSFLAILVQVAVPVYVVISSVHLVFGRSPRSFQIRFCQSVNLYAHLSIWILDICHTHLHFASLIFSMMSFTPVLCRIMLCFILSRRGTLSIWSFISIM